MSDFDEAVNAVKAHSSAYQPVLRSWAAYLGDGEGAVVGSQANYYNCRYPTPESPAVEVYANGCPPNDGLRVMVGYSADQPDLIKIVSWNDSSRDDSSNDHVKNHADQHYYLGGDTVWVDWRQITTFRVEPYSGLTVYVRGGVLPRAGADLQVIPQIVDLTSSVPGSAGQARYALLSIDSTGEIIVTDGTTVTPIMSLDASDVPATPSGNFRIAAVALQYGQTNVTESLLQRDILDLRWPNESIVGTGVITPAMLANASAQYKYLVSGATPFAYAESAGGLNIASGKTLTVSNSLTLAGTDGLTLTISGNSTINGSLVGNITGGGTLATGGFTLAVPKTGTAVTGTGTAGRITEWVTDANTLQASTLIKSGAGVLTLSSAGAFTATFPATGTVDYINVAQIFSAVKTFALGGIDGTQATQINLAATVAPTSYFHRIQSSHSVTASANKIGISLCDGTASGFSDILDIGQGAGKGAEIKLKTMNTAGSGTGQADLQFIDGTAVGFRFLAAYGNTPASSRYGGFLAGSDRDGTKLPLVFATTDTGGTSLYGIKLTAGQASGLTPSVGIGVRGAAASTPLSTIDVCSLSATTNTINTVATLGANTTGTAADGFGGSIALLLESSTTADTSAANLKWLWSTATHASRKGRITSAVYDTAERQWLQVDTDGSVPTVWFLGRIQHPGTFAAIHCHDASTAQNVATGATYAKITAFTDNGFSVNCTPDAANDKITITKAGYYKVSGSVSFSDDTNNVTWFASVFVNGTEQDQIHFTRKIGTAGDVGNAALTGIIDVTTVPWDVDLRMRHDAGGTIAITVSYANLNVEYVGET